MARPRTPTNILALKGSFKKDPDRLKERENEPENINPVGEPFDHLPDNIKAAWNEIVTLSITGVLGEADRLSIEQCARLLIKCRDQHIVAGDVVPASAQEQNQFFKYLSQFGMLPADRSKLSIPKKKPKNKFAD